MATEQVRHYTVTVYVDGHEVKSSGRNCTQSAAEDDARGDVHAYQSQGKVRVTVAAPGGKIVWQHR